MHVLSGVRVHEHCVLTRVLCACTRSLCGGHCRCVCACSVSVCVCVCRDAAVGGHSRGWHSCA